MSNGTRQLAHSSRLDPPEPEPEPPPPKSEGRRFHAFGDEGPRAALTPKEASRAAGIEWDPACSDALDAALRSLSGRQTDEWSPLFA